MLLVVLCYTLFTFLKAAPKPTVRATEVTSAQTTPGTQEKATDAKSTAMPSPIPKPPPVPGRIPSPTSSSSTPRPGPPPATPPPPRPAPPPPRPIPPPTAPPTLKPVPPPSTLPTPKPVPPPTAPPTPKPVPPPTAPPTPKPVPPPTAPPTPKPVPPPIAPPTPKPVPPPTAPPTPEPAPPPTAPPTPKPVSPPTATPTPKPVPPPTAPPTPKPLPPPTAPQTPKPVPPPAAHPTPKPVPPPAAPPTPKPVPPPAAPPTPKPLPPPAAPPTPKPVLPPTAPPTPKPVPPPTAPPTPKPLPPPAAPPTPKPVPPPTAPPTPKPLPPPAAPPTPKPVLPPTAPPTPKPLPPPAAPPTPKPVPPPTAPPTPKPLPPPAAPPTPKPVPPPTAPQTPKPVPPPTAPPTPKPVVLPSTPPPTAPPTPKPVPPPSTPPPAASPTHQPVPSSTTSPPNAPTVSSPAPPATSAPRPTPPPVKRPLGEAPLFCTFGVHLQNYDKINADVCDYAFIPYYVRGKDTFTDDSDTLTRKLLNKAVTSTKTSYAISVPHANRTAALMDLNSPAGQTTLEEYWTLKNIYHYALFDIGVKEQEVTERTKILKEAFDLLQAFRTQQDKLKAAYPKQSKPQRGFVVASIYIWQATKTPFLKSIADNFAQFLVDAVIIVTHLTVDEHEANLECFITGGAPYTITSKNPNLLGMDDIMRQISRQIAWNTGPTLAISVSMCTRVYMPAKAVMQDHELDVKCVDHLHRPNGTAAYCHGPLSIYANAKIVRPGHYTGISVTPATPQLVSTYETFETVSEKYCMLRRDYDVVTFGLALYDLECEDWEKKCTFGSSPIAGKQRFDDIVEYFRRVSKRPPDQLPCQSTP
ncbi:uncharacterized protein LOC142576024 [Dermacentor variabilis]|uniref:uncharacterized protein LOC142576024 n=1 Tax=Dermacentor variabilis TaxID=34621 RepID=UPI003F5B7C73